MANDPVWKKLVEELKRSGARSTYLDRLDGKLSASSAGAPTRGWRNLQLELLQEMAQGLGAAEDKVNLALLTLELAGRAHDEAHDEQRREALRVEFNAKRELAVTARWELMVHREALGFTDHSGLDHFYPIPNARGPEYRS